MAKIHQHKYIKKQFGKEIVVIPITIARNGFYTHGPEFPVLYQNGVRFADGTPHATHNIDHLVKSALEPVESALRKSLTNFFDIAENGEIRIEMTMVANVSSGNKRHIDWMEQRETKRLLDLAKLEEDATTYLLEETNDRKDQEEST